MIRRIHARLARALSRGEESGSGERGATLILATAALVVLLGMAGFAVDLGWLYLKTAETKKAAEAAALAGVVHMPKPSTVVWGPGALAYSTALDVASRNGHTSGVSPNEVAGKPNQLNVSISNTVPTFFMKLFGVDQVSYTRAATAEQLPPLKIGSDQAYLGTDPTDPSRNRHFFVSVNGEEEFKENGDPYSTRCTDPAPCGGTPNTQFRDPAYTYGIEVPPSSAGGAMTVQMYDPAHWDGNRNDFVNNGNPLATGDRVDQPVSITYQLHAPDQTPNNPLDNPPIAGCGQTFTDQPGSSSPGIQEWVDLCTVSASSGIYVLTVSIGGDSRSITDFSFRTLVNGNPNNNTAVFGIGSMSLDMIETASAPNFQLAKLEDYYAGTQLIISLFDPGDVTGPNADLTFVGELAGTECDFRVMDQAGNEIRPWGGDDTPGSAPCYVNTTGQRFNNQWLEFRFDIPDTYACAIDCWVNVNYNFPSGSTPTERTTWAARINGQPIHLLP